MSELDSLNFLLGRWRGRYSDQFGEKGELESNSECTKVLGERFIRWDGVTRKDGKVLNEAVQFIGYDSTQSKYFYKRFWSYGFVENGVGGWEDERTLVFDFTADNRPAWFEGMKWRSFIRKYSDSEVGTGLYSSSHGEPFKLFGESKVTRVTS